MPLTSDRVLWALLMVQLVVWWRQGLTASRPIGRNEVLLLAFVALLAVNVAMHDWTVRRDQPLSQFVFYYLMPLGIFWAGWQAKISERGLKLMFALFGVFGLYLALTAMAEKWQLTALVFPPYISDWHKYPEFFGRGRGPLLNPMANGMLMGICLGGGLTAWPRAPRWGQVLLAFYSCLLCAGIACTMTRSVWIGGALGLCLMLFLTLPRRYRYWFLTAVVLGSAALVTLQWTNILEFKRDKYAGAEETASSAELRPILFTIARKMACDRPLLGCGLAHYSEEHLNYLSDRDTDLPLEKGREYIQHNVWLSLLTETGLIGVTLFTLLLIAWLRSAWRLWRSDGAPLWMRQQGLFFLVAAANYLVNAMFHDMSVIPMVNMFLFFLAGVTLNVQAEAAEAAGCRVSV
jgi:O-antigen ligase